MLKKIYARYGGDNWEIKYNSFKEQLEMIEKCLKNRKKLTSLYNSTEVQEAIDSSVDALIEIREAQRQIEKISIFVKREKRITETDIFLDKEEKKMNFDEVAGNIILKFKNSSSKKTITSEDRKNLFRVFYKNFYKESNQKVMFLDEWIESLNDERNNLLNLRNEVQNWQNILKKKLYEN